MNSAATHKQNSHNVVENEVRHIRNIEPIMSLAVKNINQKVDFIGYLDVDYDSDYSAYQDLTIEFSFLDLRFWIDIIVKNDSTQIECVDVKDNDDNDYHYISLIMQQNLCNYYNTENKERAKLYNQSLEIQNDQSDPYNHRPKMPLGYGANAEYVKQLKSICEDDDKKIHMFLKHGYVGDKLRLNNRAKNSQLVKIILPMVKSGTFEQVNLLSDNNKIATLIFDNFRTFKGEYLNISTLKNCISSSILTC